MCAALVLTHLCLYMHTHTLHVNNVVINKKNAIKLTEFETMDKKLYVSTLEVLLYALMPPDVFLGAKF